jgi:hypothetical protein
MGLKRNINIPKRRTAFILFIFVWKQIREEVTEKMLADIKFSYVYLTVLCSSIHSNTFDVER